jgi:hypothetical protein
MFGARTFDLRKAAETRWGCPMSEAVSTYRAHADWNRQIAEVTADKKDADLLHARAQKLADLADRMEREERMREIQNPPA